MPAAALKRQHEPSWHEDIVPVAVPPHKNKTVHEEETRHAARSRAARRRAKQRHKPLRLSLPTTLCGVALLGQLTMLLYLKGQALQASHEATRLDKQITLTSNQIASTETRISQFESSARLEEWAKQRGWKRPEHSEIDVVSAAPASQSTLDSTSPLGGGETR
jgi:cell division protein FtsL